MNSDQVRDYVTSYLEATECHILERHPAFVTVKLSPEADKALTNRPYYWSFVERTGAEPETMSITFVFDQEQFDQIQAQRDGNNQTNPAPSGANGSADNHSTTATSQHGGESILARYFGVAPTSTFNRTRHEPVTYGSGRLNQIFSSAKEKGRFVNLYEHPDPQMLVPGRPTSYRSYLGVNYKIEFLCDIKRDELQELGICLSTGEIITDFHNKMSSLHLSPRLPAHTHLNDMLSLPRAVAELERYLERYLKAQDHRWAQEAEERMYDELDRIKLYYQEMIQNSKEEEEKAKLQDEYRARQDEIAWQFKPRVLVSTINCGLFHLLEPIQNRRNMTNSTRA